MTWGWLVYFIILLAAAMTGAAAWKGAPFVPTPQKAIDSALDLASVSASDTLVDIGAGDGRMLIAAAKRGAQVIGYELSPFMWLIAYFSMLRHGVKGSLKLRDGFAADLSTTTVLFLFMMPKTLPKLLNNLEKKLKPGTRIVTYAFPIPNWKPEKEIKPEDCGAIFLYLVK